MKSKRKSSKQNEKLPKGYLPKLRFPEFRNAPEWGKRTLSSLADKITTKNKKNSIIRVLTNSAVDGVVDQCAYFDREIVNQNNLKTYFVIEKGDYVYNPRISVTAPVGPISKNKIGKGIMSPLYTIFRFKNRDNDFYEQYFKTNLWHNYLKNIANTGARHDRMSISVDNFMGISLPFPDEHEQQKIADCLSSLDELITAEAQKLEKLKIHKKGLMQQLFPAEGETIPKLRFPEFRNVSKWKTEKLGNLFYERIEKNHPEKQVLAATQDRGVIPNHLLERLVIRNQESLKNYKLVAKGDFVISLRSFEGGFEYAFSEGIISPAYVIMNSAENLCHDFFRHYFKSSYFINLIQSTLNNSLRDGKSISYKQASLLHISLPENIRAQQKIAACLSSLDELILAQTQKIDKLKVHKKGLMQQLFPSSDEVNE